MDTDSLSRQIGDLLRQRQLTLAVAESCTGGLLAAHITDIPGSSDYFLGGVVSYSNQVKERLLRVPARMIKQHGAVSAATARRMASGVRQLLQADLALAVTGIAGPSGATPDKPLGLTYVAISSSEGEQYRRHLWGGDRSQNREWSAKAALELLLEYLGAEKVARLQSAGPRQALGADHAKT